MTTSAKLRKCRCGCTPVWQPWLLGWKVDIYCPGCGKVFGSYDDNPICRARAVREWNKQTKGDAGRSVRDKSDLQNYSHTTRGKQK